MVDTIVSVLGSMDSIMMYIPLIIGFVLIIAVVTLIGGGDGLGRRSSGMTGAFIAIMIAVVVSVGIAIPIVMDVTANVSTGGLFNPKEYDIEYANVPDPIEQNFETLIEESKPLDINISREGTFKPNLNKNNLGTSDLLS